MRLYLLRHAEAQSSYPDESRPLTIKGEATMAALGRFASAHGLLDDIDTIWHSPLLRARQSAEGVARAAGLAAPLQEVEGLRPEDDIVHLGSRLLAKRGELLIVGHNPHLSLLAAYLLAGEPDYGLFDLAKGALVALERRDERSYFSDGSEGSRWRLRWLLNRKIYGDD